MPHVWGSMQSYVAMCNEIVAKGDAKASR
jgi:hypothetical protein